MQIRTATTHDATTIAEFNIAMAEETEGLKLPVDVVQAGVRSLCEEPHFGFYVVAEQQSTVVASMMITYEWSDWRNGVIWWLQSVYVLPTYRRRGVFRAMHQFVTQQAAASKQVCGLRLYVDHQNGTAQRTYRDLGMTESHYRMFEQMKPFC